MLYNLLIDTPLFNTTRQYPYPKATKFQLLEAIKKHPDFKQIEYKVVGHKKPKYRLSYSKLNKTWYAAKYVPYLKEWENIAKFEYETLDWTLDENLSEYDTEAIAIFITAIG